MPGFDDLIDSIPDELPADQLESLAEGQKLPPQEAAKEPAIEAQATEATQDTHEAPSDVPEPSQEVAEEFEEVEWYGQKGKIGKNLSGFLSKFFTEKSQRLSMEHKAEIERVKAEAESVRKEREELQAYRDRIQATLDANPDLARNYRQVEEREVVPSKIKELESRLATYEEQTALAAQRSVIEAEIAALQKKYPAPDGFTAEQVRDLAVQQAVAGDGDLELAWNKIHSLLSQSTKAIKSRYLQGKVQAKEAVPASPSPGRATPKVKQHNPSDFKNLDEVLMHTLKQLGE